MKWSQNFPDENDVLDAIEFWAFDLKDFDDKCIIRAMEYVKSTGLENPPNLSQFKKICLELENKPLSPEYIPLRLRQRQSELPVVPVDVNECKRKIKEALKDLKKTLKRKIDARTDEEIYNEREANREKLYLQLQEMGIDIPRRTGG